MWGRGVFFAKHELGYGFFLLHSSWIIC